MIETRFLELFAAKEAKRVQLLNDFWRTYQEIAIPELELNTPERQAAFLAQVGHECDTWKTRTEYSSGEQYEFATRLGNNQKGDGPRFKGRGYIQLTGRYNYTEFNKFYQTIDPEAPDLLRNPQLVAQVPEIAMWATVWYWKNRNLNRWADKLMFETLTRRINGGLNGYEHREKLFNTFYKELKA